PRRYSWRGPNISGWVPQAWVWGRSLHTEEVLVYPRLHRNLTNGGRSASDPIFSRNRGHNYCALRIRSRRPCQTAGISDSHLDQPHRRQVWFGRRQDEDLLAVAI